MKNTQKGFALIESLLIILILVIIGFGGYFVWHTQKQTNKNNTDTVKVSQSSIPPSSSQKYLTIEEWGVKVPLVADDSDAYYTIDKLGGPNFANLSLKKWESTECGTTIGGIGGYFRFTSSDINGITSETYLSENQSAPKVGNYYYMYVPPQQNCSTTSKTAEPTNADIQSTAAARDALKQAITKVQTQ
jgi:hypothetical protein